MKALPIRRLLAAPRQPYTLIPNSLWSMLASVPRLIPTIFTEILGLGRTLANHLDLQMNPLRNTRLSLPLQILLWPYRKFDVWVAPEGNS